MRALTPVPQRAVEPRDDAPEAFRLKILHRNTEPTHATRKTGHEYRPAGQGN